MTPMRRFRRLPPMLTLAQVEDIMSAMPKDGIEHGFVV